MGLVRVVCEGGYHPEGYTLMAVHRCASDNGEIVWDEDKKRYACTICDKQMCADCGLYVEVDMEGIYCMRCDDEREMLSYGNI